MSVERSMRILLVEDNPADVDLVHEYLHEPDDAAFEIHSAGRISEAVERLGREHFDAIVLDLRLPDANGRKSVERIRAADARTPLIVLTGSEDEALAAACIEAGAQDYLSKGEVRSRALRRALVFAVGRVRAGEAHALERTRAGLRRLTGTANGGSGNHDRLSQRLGAGFTDLLDAYGAALAAATRPPKAALRTLARRLQKSAAAPRDLLELHLAALERAVGTPATATSALEGHLLALETLILMADDHPGARPAPAQPSEGMHAHVDISP